MFLMFGFLQRGYVVCDVLNNKKNVKTGEGILKKTQRKVQLDQLILIEDTQLCGTRIMVGFKDKTQPLEPKIDRK